MSAGARLPRLPDIAASAAAALGVPGVVDALGIGEARHAVVCLIDGLGWLQLREFSHVAPVLSSLAGGSCQASFPSTTPVGLASLGTGLDPGQHGFVGASFWVPEEDTVLSPLKWGSSPSAAAVQPEPTVFERAARHGLAVASIGPAKYADSGLTRAVLRGADYLAAETIAERATALRTQLAAGERSLTYVYWPHLDRLGHEFGVASQQWLAGLMQADLLVAALLQCQEPGTVMVVTSDHGMVNVEPGQRIDLDAIPGMLEGVVRIAGEPRVRHAYCRPGAAGEVLDRWTEVMGPHALVLSREQVAASGYLGDVDPALEDRLGDVVAIARDQVAIASRVDRLVSGLRGQHGALTDEEMLVPALIAGP